MSAVLETRGLTRSFGGLTAVAQVDLTLAMGELHAVIGPNGAGKSTLINLLSGDLRPSSGEIRLDGQSVAGLPAHRMARLGIGRSYQKTNILKSLPALENARLAAQARQGGARLFRRAAGARDLLRAAEAALARAGLTGDAGRLAGQLSHGEQRQLEIAMTLATEPRVLGVQPAAGRAGGKAQQRGRPSRACWGGGSRWPAWAPRRPSA